MADTGHLTDPLAWHRAPSDELLGGNGLWLVNQVCDLVQARTGQAGTTTRLHMRLNGHSPRRHASRQTHKRHVVQDRLPLGLFMTVAPCRDESRDHASANRSPEPFINGLVFTLEGLTLVR